MTKEEMIKNFMSKAPKEMAENVRLFDVVLPPLFDQDNTTLQAVVSSAKKLSYDENKAVILAVFDECQYILRALPDKVVAMQSAVDKTPEFLSVDSFVNEMRLSASGYELDQKIIHAIIEEGKTCLFTASCDRTISKASRDGVVFEKKYFESTYRAGETMEMEQIGDIVFTDDMMPKEIAAVKDSLSLERINPKGKTSVY